MILTGSKGRKQKETTPEICFGEKIFVFSLTLNFAKGVRHLSPTRMHLAGHSRALQRRTFRRTVIKVTRLIMLFHLRKYF